MRLFFSCMLLFFFVGTMQAQENPAPSRSMPVVSPQKMALRRLEAQIRGLENALQAGSAADINHYYGSLLMHLRTSIQEQEAKATEGAPAPPALERQRGILASFEGFEFSKASPEMVAEKLNLLRAYAEIKKAEVKD